MEQPAPPLQRHGTPFALLPLPRPETIVDLPTPLPLLLALSPALFAIGVALLTQKVVPSLLTGMFVGAAVAHLEAIFNGKAIEAFEALGAYFVEALIPGLSRFELSLRGEGEHLGGYVEGDLSALDTSHLLIIAFSLCVAGMVGVLGRSGGTRAMVRVIERFARGPRGAQVAAWLSGGLVFFDDYANCLVVGSAMGPIFDRFQISRAKLAFIVDCTAAPIASIALISTWVGYELGLINTELNKLGSEHSALGLFVAALPYAFYALTALTMVGAVAILGRDFGPMLHEERQARSRPPKVDEEPPSHPLMALAALVPVLLLVVLTLIFLLHDGRTQLAERGQLAQASTLEVLAAADPFLSLLWGSSIALAIAALLAVFTGGLALFRVPAAVWVGIKPVLGALVVLFLAWGLGNAMTDTKAAEHLTELVRPADRFVHAEGETTIPFTLTAATHRAEVTIFNPQGFALHSELLRDLDPGEQRYTWDGRSSLGASAPAGPYRLQVKAYEADGTPVESVVRGQDRFPVWLLPAVVFLVAAATAFATGTSFGTMAILIPLVIPLGFTLQGGEVGPVILGSLAAVLSGSILGDHASPISDTTVLSALGAGVDLVLHVKTQLPYALTAGTIALLFGFIPAGWGVSPWLLIPLCLVTTVLTVRLVGQRVSGPAPPPSEDELVVVEP
ncbi:MAG: hypothetical protein EA397_07790 [Deltaproteobacteria bacterium]|nr:MAG: hypothetical protein EA397_07790 [Deltaproteobacteria bacterium]